MTKVKQKSIYNFAYSVGFVRTLETLLLNENEVERMVLAKDADDAFKILNEFDYADNKSGVDNPADFQKVINEGIVEIKEMLENVTPNKRILNILWHDYDFHNIKTMLKAKLSGKTFEEIEYLLSDLGAIDTEKMRQFIFDESTTVIWELDKETEEYLKSRIIKIQKKFEKDKNPQIIDLYMDQKLMRIKRGIADYSQNEFLINYVRKLIDLNNIRLFFRMKSQEKPQELFELALIWKGHIPYQKFIHAFKEGKLEEFVEAMSATPYSDIISQGFKHYQEEKTFIYLEKEIENYLINYIKSAKLIPFGPEPLIAYFLAKKNNALIIRMVLINKLNKIEPEEIRKRLRTLYS
ncbi:V-type ATPase subunit [Patescibacteria group bacterium]